MMDVVRRHAFGRHACLWGVIALGWILISESAVGQPRRARRLGLRLPTQNEALFSARPSSFYMHVDRSFEGRTSTPWQGGKYGYVRNPKRVGGGLVYTRFHEGVDIAPVKRGRDGEPLDTVHAIADGKVVHANPVAGRSNYGRYVVVEHDWGYGPFYSLYAHLKSISVEPGRRVRAGGRLGSLGYTGAGINRRRAHLHLELNLLLNRRFEVWHSKAHTSPNHHGVYNGLNMAGLDIAGLYRAQQANPDITIPEFMSRMQPYYKVTLPKSPGFDLLRRYPWLLKGGGRSARAGVSWEITFSRSGVPLAVAPSLKMVRSPVVTWVRHSPHYHSWNTRSRLTGSGKRATLSSGGRGYVQLVGGLF